MDISVDKDIDVLGKPCPLPLITLAREARVLSKGRVIRIVGNDPIFEPSVIDFCAEGGHEVIEINREGRSVTIIFRLGGGEEGE